MPDFYKRLVRQQRTLLFVLLCVCSMAAMVVSDLIVLGGSMWDTLHPWQESTAFWTRASVYGLILLAWILGVVWIIVHRPQLTQLAQAVENKHPKFMDALTCAVEIQETHGGPRNNLEEALFRQVESEAETINFTTAILPQKIHPLIIVGLGIGLMAFSGMAGQTTVQQKFEFYLRDWLAGTATGLLVTPADTERPTGSDLTVFAEITRWEQAAFIEYQIGGAATETFPMYLNPAGIAEFTLYGLHAHLRYRVSTPSLRSPWYQLEVFDPPEIQSIAIDVKPPEYTGEAPSAFTKLVNLFVTEGTRIRYQVAVDSNVTGKLVTASSESTLHPVEGKQASAGSRYLAAESMPLGNTDYRLRLINAEGRTFITDSYNIEVIPDELPVVEFIEPGRDVDAVPTDAVPLEIYVADDYAVSQLEISISVSGLPRQPIVVFQREAAGQAVLEQNFFSTLELQLLGVEPGDVISYHATVWDNKEPQAQRVHSDKFFVEVIGPVPESDPMNMAGGAGADGETVEIDFRALIVELKRLIRVSHETQFIVGEKRELNCIEIAAGLSALHDEGNSILNKIQGLLQAAERGEIFLLFKNTLEYVGSAERAVNDDQLELAIPVMEEAYSGLLNLERYFASQQQNQAQQGAGEGQGSEPTSANEAAEEPPEDEGMSIAELRQALDSVQSLIDKQSAMNSRFTRAEKTKPDQPEQLELANLQSEIEGDAAALKKLLKKDPDSFPIRRHLRSSHEDMHQAAAAAAQNDMGRANRFGVRAKEDLLTASSLLSARIREAATQKIDHLSQHANTLARQQSEASQATQDAMKAENPVSSEQLRTQQDVLKNQFDKLMAAMDRVSIDLEDTYPEISEALTNVSRESAAKNIDGTMAKATNALLYERFQRAARSQDKAAASLQELAQGLRQTSEMVPRMSAEEMQSLLQNLMAANEQMQAQPGEAAANEAGEQRGQGEQPGNNGEESQAGQGMTGQSGKGDRPSPSATQHNQLLAKDMAQELARAGRMLKDSELAQLGAELSAPDQAAHAASHGNAAQQAILEQAIRIIQQRIQKTWIEDKASLNRRSALPPEKYRSLVEDYFRKLAEEE